MNIKALISAGIVLYNPNIARLKKNIDAIAPQVDVVYCFNNGAYNLNEIIELVSKYTNVQIIDGKKNHGISYALNRISEQSINTNHKWMLALDQDSVCPSNMIDKFSHYLNYKNVGIICPVAVDKRRPKQELPKEELSFIDDTITSGSLMNLDIYKKIGGSDEYLFVGLVDDEYCYRLRLNGYQILQVNSVIMDHELGELTPSKFANFYLRLGDKLHSSKIKALSYKRKVSPMRVYYATRNIIYLSKKYKSKPTYLFSKKFALKNGISNILRSQNKLNVTKAFFNGLKDGRRCN